NNDDELHEALFNIDLGDYDDYDEEEQPISFKEENDNIQNNNIKSNVDKDNWDPKKEAESMLD
ncbi:10577_t:CDS:2, partial [Gigaspora margarita]